MIGEDMINKSGKELSNQAATAGFKRLALALIPFTPVPFTGDTMLLAVARVALYGGLAAYTYKKKRKVSYALMAAAGVSASTSLLSDVFNRQEPVK